MCVCVCVCVCAVVTSIASLLFGTLKYLEESNFHIHAWETVGLERSMICGQCRCDGHAYVVNCILGE